VRCGVKGYLFLGILQPKIFHFSIKFKVINRERSKWSPLKNWISKAFF
jgi:hypothetical protein